MNLTELFVSVVASFVIVGLMVVLSGATISAVINVVEMFP